MTAAEEARSAEMPIPKTREELLDWIATTYIKLEAELDSAGPRLGSLPCVDDWTVKDLLAVRAWWTERVLDWIDAGLRGEVPVTPAPGYRWKETPRLNAEFGRKARRQSYREIRRRLAQGHRRLLRTIDALDDAELLGVGAFEWAGSYPLSRWISINTARQYQTARSFIRKALRER